MKEKILNAALDIINNKQNKQSDIAKEYRRLMYVERVEGDGFIDWKTINKAIMNRYSNSGLIRIKQLAWKVS